MEGAIIFASLVVGVAITDQLTSLHHLLRRRGEVKWDPLCLAVALLVQLTIIMIWWTLARSSEQSVTIGAFLPSFLVLVLLFLLAAATLPDKAGTTDLRDYYDRQSPYIWALYTVASLTSSLTGVADSLMRGQGWMTILDRYGVDLVVVTFLMGSLIFVRKRWWHWVALAVLSVGPINWLRLSLG